jgi:hypothetical protein
VQTCRRVPVFWWNILPPIFGTEEVHILTQRTAIDSIMSWVPL